MRGAALVILALLLAGCGTTAARHDAGGSHSSSTSPATSSPSSRPSPQVPGTTAPPAVPAWGGCKKGPVPGRGVLAFDFNPTKDINSEQANAPGDVFTVNADGAGLRRLTFGLDATSPSWSPDGKQLAFVRTNWRGNHGSALWIMNADGSGQRRLSSVGNVLSPPDWSPDGEHLAVAEGERWVVVLDLPSLRKRRLQLGVRGWSDPEAPRWSADGRHLLVEATKNGEGPDDYTNTLALFTMDAEAGGHAAKVPGTKNLLGHDWSWTSCRAVLSEGLDTRGGDGNGDLFATTPGLLSTKPVLVAKGRQAFPTWSPDAQRIAYANHGGLWVAHADGSNPYELVPPQTQSARSSAGSNAAIHHPDWQPLVG